MVSGDCFNATCGQAIYLIAHQCNQLCYDDSQTAQQKGWHLVADGLATADREDSHYIPPSRYRSDRCFLVQPKRVVASVPVQQDPCFFPLLVSCEHIADQTMEIIIIFTAQVATLVIRTDQ